MIRAVILMGPPGSGKGTEAALLSQALHLTHFDTGWYLETVVNNPQHADNAVIKRQKKLFDQGQMMDEVWVAATINERIEKLARSGADIILSGSPRTVDQAFGSDTQTGIMILLERYYGKENVIIIYLRVKPETSILRNSQRLICSGCGRPAPPGDPETVCISCGGRLIRRSLDTPLVIRRRLEEFRAKTLPLRAAFEEHGYRVVEVDAEGEPQEVCKEIMSRLSPVA